MMKMMRRKGEQDCHGKRGEKKRMTQLELIISQWVRKDRKKNSMRIFLVIDVTINLHKKNNTYHNSRM